MTELAAGGRRSTPQLRAARRPPSRRCLALGRPRRSRSSAGTALTAEMALALFDAQLGNRALDIAGPPAARARAAATTRSARPATRPTPRSRRRCARPTRRCCTTGRAASTSREPRRCPASTALRDVLLGLVASADEPIAGGRHKVFGIHDLAVIPQTSTIASHLPRAVGVALRDRPRPQARRRRRLAAPTRSPSRSFGDASANHSTAAGAINAACHVAHQRAADAGAVRLRGQRPRHQRAHAERTGSRRRTATGLGCAYFSADGSDLAACFDAAVAAADHVRAAPRAGVPAPARRAVHGPRRHRRRDHLPQPCRDRCGLRPRPAPRHRPAARRAGSADAGRGRSRGTTR